MGHTINKEYGSGGACLNPHGGSFAQPSLKDVMQGLADQISRYGLLVKAPTTPSTQASGTGALSWHVDIDAGEVRIEDHFAAFTAAADYDVYSAAPTKVLAAQDIYARLVAKLVTSTVSLAVVFGTAAANGAAIPPTDAEVAADLGAGVPWIDIALLFLSRNSGTTLTQTQQNSYYQKVLKGTTD